MQTVSKPDSASTKKDGTPARRPVRRLDTPNRPVAIARFVGNTFKEAILHPTVTSTLDMRTGKVIARDGKKLSDARKQ